MRKKAVWFIHTGKSCLPELIALVLVVVSLCIWVSGKEGYHMDEMISFELSNAEYNPWIVPTQPEGRLAKFMREEIDGGSIGETVSNVIWVLRDTLTNGSGGVLANFKADVYEEPVWISREQFHDYIAVEKEDAFNYFSVYFNVKDDVHPPVYYMLLHTISSIFRGRVSPWTGCSVNIIAVAGCCVLLMVIGRKWCGGRWRGITAALLFGMSAGGIATTLLTRMYGVLAFCCLLVLYLHMEKWENNRWTEKNKLLVFATALGFWTQYFFLFYMIGLALVTVIAMAVKRRRKDIFCYIRTMVTAGVIGLGLFPFAVYDVLSGERGVEALGNLAQGLNGYGTRLASFGKILAESMCAGWAGAGIFLLLMSAALVSGICRRKGALQKAGKNKQSTAKDMAADKKTGVMPWLILFPALLYFLLVAKMSPFLVDRYIMPLFPMVALAAAFCMDRCRIPALCGAAAALCLGIFSVATYDGDYLYRGYEEQVKIAGEYGSLPCVCVYGGYGFYENLPEFAEYEQTLLLKTEELQARGADDVLDGADRIVVLAKRDIDANMLEEMLLEKYGYCIDSVLLEQGVHGDSIWLCER